jgi:hypothetical protein
VHVAPDSNVDAACHWDDIEAIGVALRDVTGGGTVNEDAASHEPRRVDCSNKLFVVGGESEFLAFLRGSLGFLGVSLRPAIFFSMVVLTTLGAVERRFDVVVPAIGTPSALTLGEVAADFLASVVGDVFFGG